VEKYVITGGNRLNGKVRISGAKNAAVAILPAAILCDEPCIIENVPDISDVSELINILYELGAKIRTIDKSTIEIDSSNIASYVVPFEKTKRLRASSYFLGAMLGRFSKACVAPPGGCDFGTRPIDQHIKGFEALNAQVSTEHGIIKASAKKLLSF